MVNRSSLECNVFMASEHHHIVVRRDRECTSTARAYATALQSGNLKFAGNEQTLPEPINKKMCDFLSLLFMDSVTERNLNHDLRVKNIFFLDHVTCMEGLTIILELKKYIVDNVKKGIDRHV